MEHTGQIPICKSTTHFLLRLPYLPDPSSPRYCMIKREMNISFFWTMISTVVDTPNGFTLQDAQMCTDDSDVLALSLFVCKKRSGGAQCKSWAGLSPSDCEHAKGPSDVAYFSKFW